MSQNLIENEELKPLIDIHDTYFSCTQCGKCCESNFPLTFDEMFKYKDTFIQKLRLQLHMYPSYLSANEYIEIKSLFNKIYVPISLKEFNYQTMFISVQPIQSGYSAMCSQLSTENKCNIYHDRPINCMSLPLEATLPDTLQAKHYVHWILDGGKKKFECNLLNINTLPIEKREGKQSADLFIHWNDVDKKYEFNSEFETAYRSEQNDLINCLELKKEILNQHLQYTQSTMLELYQFLQKHPMITHLGSVISSFISKNKCTKKDAAIFFNSQLDLIDSEINLAKKRKNKEDRAETTFLNEMKTIYKLYLDVLINE